MKLVKFTVPFLAALMLVGPMSAPSAAQDTTAGWTWSSPSAVETEPWRFSAGVPGWLPNAPVHIETEDGDAFYPESLYNILKAMKFPVVMAEGGIYKGPFGAFVSLIYYKGEVEEDFTGPLEQERHASLREEVWLLNYVLSYDLGTLRLGENPDSPTVTLQPFAGGLFLHDKVNIDVDPGGKFGSGLKLDTTIEFNTPIIGLNTLWHFTDRWSARIGGNYGGFGVDDVTETYEVNGRVAYHFDLWGAAAQAFVGYRYLHIDVDDGLVALKVTIKGPIVGIGFNF